VRMNSIVKTLLFDILFATTVLGCQNLRPETIELPTYPDLNKVLEEQSQLLAAKSLQKEVTLGEKTETSSFAMDTAKWKSELDFLEEINPCKPEYVGVYEVVKNDQSLQLTLGPKEKSVLTELNILYQDEDYARISASIHEDKDVYTHHRDIKVVFRNALISSWTIQGYQKMMLSDTVRFGISGSVR